MLAYIAQRLMTGFVTLFAVAAIVFLVMRVIRTGGDSRFDEMKHHPRESSFLRSLSHPLPLPKQ